MQNTLQESNVTVPYVLGTEAGEGPLLTVAAYDEDGPGLNEINYFLVPECEPQASIRIETACLGSDSRFHINQSSGAISLDARLDAIEDLQLCIVARLAFSTTLTLSIQHASQSIRKPNSKYFSPNPTLNPASITFDSKNVSHLPVTISVRTPKAMVVPRMPPLRNNTVNILGASSIFNSNLPSI